MKVKKELEPILLTKGENVYVRTIHGSYVNKDDYGMSQQKNAKSLEELLKLGYK